MTLILADRAHPARPRLERLVRRVFSEEYGARVPAFPDRLLARLDDAGEPMAVAGLRLGGESLFSEAYLDSTAAEAIGRACGRIVQRPEIVEFSNLAAVRSGAAMPLVMAGVRLSLAVGARYGMFTATQRLRALLRRRGLVAIDLGPAQPDKLANAATWGRYYLHDPRVVVVSAETLPDSFLSIPLASPAPLHA